MVFEELGFVSHSPEGQFMAARRKRRKEEIEIEVASNSAEENAKESSKNRKMGCKDDENVDPALDMSELKKKSGFFLVLTQLAEESKVMGKKTVVGMKELVAEILIRLPWNDVSRFKSVSRQWLKLISEPSFVAQHQTRNLSLLGFLYNTAKSSQLKFTRITKPETGRLSTYLNLMEQHLPRWPENKCFRILCTSNGLALHLDRVKERAEGVYRIHNPITGETLKLPPSPPIERSKSRFIVYGLAFVPSPHRPYAVAVEISNDGDLDLRINSFSSKARRWESQVYNVTSFIVFPKGYILLGDSPTFLSGCLHWLVKPAAIVAYDIKTKCVSLINIPSSSRIHKNKSRNYLGDCQERLVYVVATADYEFCVWTLDDYYLRKWSVRQRVIIPGGQPSPSPPISRVLGFDPRDSQVMFIKLEGNMYSCHLGKREKKEMLHNIGNTRKRIVPYKLPSSSPPPQDWFSLLFGNLLCQRRSPLSFSLNTNGTEDLNAHGNEMPSELPLISNSSTTDRSSYVFSCMVKLMASQIGSERGSCTHKVKPKFVNW